MRVTTRMLNQSLINNINGNLARMERYQNQLSSGRKIDKPSDDPIATGQLLTAKSALKAQEQYSSNMQTAAGWLDTVDGALESAGDVLQRAREIAVTGANGTLAQDSMGALADDVDNMIAELVGIANTNYAGRYVFGGGKTGSTPFTISGKDAEDKTTSVQFISAAFDESLLDQTYAQEIEIEAGVTINISCGKSAFHSDIDGNDAINAIFTKMIELRTELDGGDQQAVKSIIGDFDKMIDNVLSERAVVGAKSKRIEVAQSRLEVYGLNLIKLVSSLEDADYAEASTGFSTQQTVYEASLAVGARIIQPSLIDFLK